MRDAEQAQIDQDYHLLHPIEVQAHQAPQAPQAPRASQAPQAPRSRPDYAAMSARKKAARSLYLPRKGDPCPICLTTDHQLKSCVKASDDGYMDGCGQCNSLRHHYFECPAPNKKPTEDFHYGIQCRTGRPPIRLDRDVREIQRYDKNPHGISISSLYPWTAEYSKRNRSYWDNFVYLPDHSQEITHRDPAWDDVNPPPRQFGGGANAPRPRQLGSGAMNPPPPPIGPLGINPPQDPGPGYRQDGPSFNQPRVAAPPAPDPDTGLVGVLRDVIKMYGDSQMRYGASRGALSTIQEDEHEWRALVKSAPRVEDGWDESSQPEDLTEEGIARSRGARFPPRSGNAYADGRAGKRTFEDYDDQTPVDDGDGEPEHQARPAPLREHQSIDGCAAKRQYHGRDPSRPSPKDQQSVDARATRLQHHDKDPFQSSPQDNQSVDGRSTRRQQHDQALPRDNQSIDGRATRRQQHGRGQKPSWRPGWSWDLSRSSSSRSHLPSVWPTWS